MLCFTFEDRELERGFFIIKGNIGKRNIKKRKNDEKNIHSNMRYSIDNKCISTRATKPDHI